jgi:hypothetical protein
VVVRDGGDELARKHEGWARAVFERAMQTSEDAVHRFRAGLRFNPFAIAFVGFVHLLRLHRDSADMRILLQLAASHNPAGAHGFCVATDLLESVDTRLPRALLRCAFAARVQPCPRYRSNEEADEKDSNACYEQHLCRIVDSEIAWLTEEGPEPEWPDFPAEAPGVREPIRFGRSRQEARPPSERARPDSYTDHQGAALWLSSAISLFDISSRPWLCEIVRRYSSWTAVANGAGLPAHERIDHTPSEWNLAFFALASHCVLTLDPAEVDELLLRPIQSLPDEAFFNVATDLLRALDTLYFSDRGLRAGEAVRVRAVLARRLMASAGWQRLKGSRADSIDTHIGRVIAAFFMNDYNLLMPPRAYLYPKGIERLSDFIDVLLELIKDGPSIFLAQVTLNLMEVAPQVVHLRFILSAAGVWVETFRENRTFWIEFGVGQRVCALLEQLCLIDPRSFKVDTSTRASADRLLAALVSIGVPEACSLERALAQSS